MNTKLPIIALDVDGVIAPLGGADHFPEAALAAWDSSDLIQAQSPGAFGLYSIIPALDFLREVHTSGRAAVQWHTSWRTNAPKILGPDFNLPEWPLLEDNGAYLHSQGWWKLDAIKDALAAGHDVIWVDDDISDAVETGEVDASMIADSHLHIVSPNVLVGLTKNDLTDIDNKLKEWGF